MNKDFNSNTENKDEWFTPRYIPDSLGKFDLDPCDSFDCTLSPIASTRYNDRGLEEFWFGRVWCNPPYGKETFKWIEKLANSGNGIALIFARTETRGFHEQIWQKADAIFFFKGRLRFYHKNGKQGGTANAPSCLVAYGQNNVSILESCNLNGQFIKLKGE